MRSVRLACDGNAVVSEIDLRYGTNPHQTPARARRSGGPLPFTVLNGAPGYINLLDALNGWPLVRELWAATGEPAAASFKHVSPAGAAIGLPLSEALQRAYALDGTELSPLAAAYARARGGDLISSYGDFAACSDTVDASVAQVLRREVSDGIIAPAYDADALEILRGKKAGKYLIVQIDPDFEPPPTELRDVFGIQLEQPRDAEPLTRDRLANVVTKKSTIPPEAQRDLLVATIALRYTQSNSVCVANGGQVIGLGAGQQSRIHCSRIACSKADRWMLLQHPRVLQLPLRKELKRPERFTAREQFIAHDELSPAEQAHLASQMTEPVQPLSPEERRAWIGTFTNVLSHDAFMPFRDNVDRAQASGVRYILQPGGSIADEGVIAAADEYGMAMAFSGLRLFHH